MGIGGVVLASVGIIMVVLVSNGRWDNVWKAVLGGATTSPGARGTSGDPSLSVNEPGVADMSHGSVGGWKN